MRIFPFGRGRIPSLQKFRQINSLVISFISTWYRYFHEILANKRGNSWRTTMWKLWKFTLKIFWQKYCESNGFTKCNEITKEFDEIVPPLEKIFVKSIYSIHVPSVKKLVWRNFCKKNRGGKFFKFPRCNFHTFFDNNFVKAMLITEEVNLTNFSVTARLLLELCRA